MAYERYVPGMTQGGREIVTFHDEPILNNGKSEAAGRPIFDTIEMVEIRFAGNTLTVIDREVTDEDKRRWPDHYKAYKQGAADVHVSGTPLKAWPAMGRAQVAEMAAVNIFTVEQLASVDDYFCQRIGMGGMMWRKRAQDYLEAAEDAAHVDKLSAASQRKDEQIAAMTAQIAQMGDICERLQRQVHQLEANASAGTIMGIPDARAAIPAYVAPRAPVDTAGALGAADASYVAPKRLPGRPRKDAQPQPPAQTVAA